MLVNENPSFCEDDQLAAIEDLVAHGIQALAIMPSESNRVREALDHLTDDLFIPIVTFNSDLIRTKRKCYVGLDNKKSGHVAAGLMSMLTGAGTFTNSVNNLRVEGFLVYAVQTGICQALDKKKKVSLNLRNFPFFKTGDERIELGSLTR